MKEPARDIKNYRTDLSAALEDTFQRRALDKFAVDYRASRERIYSGLNDRELIAEVAARKDESVRHLDELFVQFKEEAEKRGVQVHLARDAADANRIALNQDGDIQWEIAEAGKYDVKVNIGDNSISIAKSKQDGVESIVADDNAGAEYFNLLGVKVENPSSGIYICRRGSKTSKVMIR